VPPGVEDRDLYHVRSVATVLPKDLDWELALDDWHHCRTLEHPNPGFVGKRAVLERPASGMDQGRS
jgi:hypothetical protein